MRPDRRVLAKLRTVPCGIDGRVSHTMKLVHAGDAYRVEVVALDGFTKVRKQWVVRTTAKAVHDQLALLKRAKVPAFPISPSVCDGEFVELTVQGEGSTLTLGWWTIAPAGAIAFARFASWIRELAQAGRFKLEDDAKAE